MTLNWFVRLSLLLLLLPLSLLIRNFFAELLIYFLFVPFSTKVYFLLDLKRHHYRFSGSFGINTTTQSEASFMDSHYDITHQQATRPPSSPRHPLSIWWMNNLLKVSGLRPSVHPNRWSFGQSTILPPGHPIDC